MKRDEPYAEIRQIGRWTWKVAIVHGPGEWGRWYVLGKGRAERKARRMLPRYVRWRSRLENAERVA